MVFNKVHTIAAVIIGYTLLFFIFYYWHVDPVQQFFVFVISFIAILLYILDSTDKIAEIGRAHPWRILTELLTYDKDSDQNNLFFRRLGITKLTELPLEKSLLGRFLKNSEFVIEFPTIDGGNVLLRSDGRKNIGQNESRFLGWSRVLQTDNDIRNKTVLPQVKSRDALLTELENNYGIKQSDVLALKDKNRQQAEDDEG